MKIKNLITCFFLGFTITSCIQDEALNAEADILTCTVPQTTLIAEPIIQNDEIIIMVSKATDLTRIAPYFTFTSGASITPASGTERNFNNETKSLTYKVTSEDGKWSKEYTVLIVNSDLATVYNFEDVTKVEPYYVFAEKLNGAVTMQWASGNGGYVFTGVAEKPEDFPTIQSPDGKEGKCLQLVTQSTGSFGSSLPKPMRIAAGNLFIGNFDLISALQDALKATRFGLPFYNVPTYLTGYYKYHSGDQFTTADGAVVNDKRDICDIYAIFYETDENVKYLDGTNAFTSPNLISVARIEKAKETGNLWTQFYLPFISKPGKSIDKDKLKAGKYNIAIVFSSSLEGDKFNGSVGSTLFIDKVQLLYNSENE